MRRYQFLQKDDVYSALNKLRDAFLAARNGEEVEEIINGLLSYDEKIKIGRRIQIAECLKRKLTVEEIMQILKVGKATITQVGKLSSAHPLCFMLIKQRSKKVEQEYNKGKYTYLGGSKLVIKRKIKTYFSEKAIKR